MMATFDPRIPSIARVYDYLLGGKDNFAADREVAEKLLAVYPPIIETVPESRRFVARAVSWAAAEQGITQFVDLGAGLPTAPNTHETAQAASPAAVIAYIDNDPIVISHLTALLAQHNDRVAVISADLRDRDAILDDPGLRALIDLSRPVCVVMGMILHFETAGAASALVKRYMSAMAPGSCLIATIASEKAPWQASSTRPTTPAGSPRCITTRRRISRRSSMIWRSSRQAWVTHGKSAPAGASSCRRRSGPTEYSQASLACGEAPEAGGAKRGQNN
jgi:hypothetical protein